MRTFAPFVLVLIIAGVFGFAGYALAEDQPLPKKEAVVRSFVKAFFSEDKKAVLDACSGQMKIDMQKYFWIKSAVAGEKPTATNEWNGKLEILGSKREKVMNTFVELTQSQEDTFEIKVDGRRFSVAVDNAMKVILFNEASKPTADAK